jgi:hypothetical protein
MTTNYHTPLTTATRWLTTDVNPVFADLDKAITDIRKVFTLTSSANVTIDWSQGHKQEILLAHDVAFTHSGGVDGETYILYIRQSASAAKTPTWVNTRYGTEVTAIVISATLSSENIVGFIYRTGIGYCAVSSVSAYVAA